MNGATPKNVFEYIRAAAKLRLQLEPWRRDQRFTREEDNIFYAVDTDIVKLFSDPVGNKKYAAVFPGDEDKTSEILAWALGQFIFFRLTEDRPLLVIPPHHEEMDRVFAGITKNALKEQAKLCEVWPNIAKYSQEYIQTQDEDAFISALEKEPLDLVAFVQGGDRGPTAELSRFVEMLAGERLLHIERFVDRRSGSPKPLPMLHDAFDANDFKTLKKLSKDWAERIGKTKGKANSKTAISDDIEVLARLEWINSVLAETGERLVLISGDIALHKAASAYAIDSENSFADLYVRTPTVFMDAPNFLTTSNEDGDKGLQSTNLIGWLDVFLARFKPGSLGYDIRLQGVIDLSDKDGEILAEEFLQNIPDCVSNLQRDWQSFVRLVAVQYSLSLDHEENSKSEHLKKIISEITEKGLQRVKEKVEAKVSQKWLAIWKSATLAGYWSTSALERRTDVALNPNNIPPLRGVPALRFTFEPVQTHVRDLCRSLQHENIISPKFSFDELTEQDPTGYAAVTLYALAFGAAGRWGVTRTMAQQALHIAQTDTRKHDIAKGHEPITGNEAAFLLAWAIRQNAKSVDQLSEARESLDNAKSYKLKATNDDSADIRYESESIALDLTYQLFRIFGEKEIPAHVPSLALCQDRIITLLEDLEQTKDIEDYILLTVKRQLFAFLFCTLLVREFKENEGLSEKEKQRVLLWLPKFKTFLDNNEKCLITCFTQPIYLVTFSLYGPESERSEYAKVATEILNEARINYCQVMPYDTELYSFYKNIVA